MTSSINSLTKNENVFQISEQEILFRKFTQFSLKTVLPFVKSKNPEKKGAMVLYAAFDFGSLGDQAMFCSVMKGLKTNDYDEIALLSQTSPSESESPIDVNSFLNPKYYFDGSLVQSFNFQKKFASNNGFFIIGADVMDGYYSITNSLRRIHLLKLANSFGLPTKVFGFSFNEYPANEVVKALRELPKEVELLARDPISHNRMENQLDRPIRLVADLAFLLEPDPYGESASTTLDWIQGQKEEDAIIVGINANALLARNNFQDPFPIASGFANVINELSKSHSNMRFVMIAHDFRGTFNDVMLNRIITEIACFSNKELKKKIFIMPTPCSAAEVKAVCKELDFAITGRMHLAIACLGQGTPALCIGYQGKMEGLFEHFELQNMVIAPDKAFSSNELIIQTNNMLKKLVHLKEHIDKKLPMVLSLAKKNFE